MKHMVLGLWKKKYKPHKFLLVLERTEVVGQWLCSKFEESWEEGLFLPEDIILRDYTFVFDGRNMAKLPDDILGNIPELQAQLEKVKHEPDTCAD
jgi:hypothetical protein